MKGLHCGVGEYTLRYHFVSDTWNIRIFLLFCFCLKAIEQIGTLIRSCLCSLAQTQGDCDQVCHSLQYCEHNRDCCVENTEYRLNIISLLMLCVVIMPRPEQCRCHDLSHSNSTKELLGQRGGSMKAFQCPTTHCSTSAVQVREADIRDSRHRREGKPFFCLSTNSR